MGLGLKGKSFMKVNYGKQFYCLIPFLGLFALVLFVGSSSAVGAETRDAEAGCTEAAVSLDTVLQRIRAAAAGVETVACGMEQKKYLKAFAEVLEARGKFAFQRPDCWRWELTEPVLSGLAVCAESGWRWHEKGGGREAFKLADEPWLQHFATQVTAWTTADFAFLQKQYTITLLSPATVAVAPVLKLVPRDPAALRLIAALEITFAENCRYVTRIIIREADGDYTTISFFDVMINQALPEGSFRN